MNSAPCGSFAVPRLLKCSQRLRFYRALRLLSPRRLVHLKLKVVSAQRGCVLANILHCTRLLVLQTKLFAPLVVLRELCVATPATHPFPRSRSNFYELAPEAGVGFEHLRTVPEECYRSFSPRLPHHKPAQQISLHALCTIDKWEERGNYSKPEAPRRDSRKSATSRVRS